MTGSRVRAALDWLLRTHPGFDLVAINWQLGKTEWEPAVYAPEPMHEGVWVLVELGQPSEDFDRVPAWAVHHFAIFKATGAVHGVQADGAVTDDPLWVPGSSGQGNLPIPTSYANVGIVLRDMAERVEAGDSFEGSIEYSLPDPPDWVMRGEPEPDGFDRAAEPEVLMRCSYRIGNSMGQGGLRIVGSINEGLAP